MASWNNIYKSRIVTPDEAVRNIKSGMHVFLTGNCSVPQKVLAALVNYAPELQNVEIYRPSPLARQITSRQPWKATCGSIPCLSAPTSAKLFRKAAPILAPSCFPNSPSCSKRGHLPVDIALIHISPPDEHGFCSLGIETGLTKSAAESAKIIIAEVNQQMPRCLGDAFIHVSRLNYVVPVDYPLPELSMGEEGGNPIIEKMASYIAELIPDGATMQLGIGAIPDAVLKFLFEKRDLGIHTELFSDGIIDLVEAGVLTNARKTLHTGKIAAGFIIGTRRLYDWVDDNPLIELHPTEYINDPFVIAQNERMVAVNSAIEVDLTGQVCADSIGPKFYSGVGGQLDFIYGASRSKGGVPIIALPSKAKEISRIVTTLKPGAGVVTTRNHIHYVVTEYGVADLYGKTIRQRAQALINVAHPDFRDRLAFEARELHWM